MSKITRVELTSFRFDVEGLSLPRHGAAGVGNLIALKGGSMPATRWAVRIFCDDGCGRIVRHPLGGHAFLVRPGADAGASSDRP